MARHRIVQVLCLLGFGGNLCAQTPPDNSEMLRELVRSKQPSKQPSDEINWVIFDAPLISDKQIQPEELRKNEIRTFDIDHRSFAVKSIPERTPNGTITARSALSLITLIPAESVGSPPFLWIDIASPSERHFEPAVLIKIRDSRTSDFDWGLMKRAAREVEDLFSSAATEALRSVTDTTAASWHDLGDTVCRAHQKKFSLVLPRPYFEDVEYCVRLFSDSVDEVKFLLLAQATVSVSKNSNSGYRDPSSDEMTPYGETLIKLSSDTKLALAAKVRNQGWHITLREQRIEIDGRGRQGIHDQP